jgi:hypothetical protein
VTAEQVAVLLRTLDALPAAVPAAAPDHGP